MKKIYSKTGDLSELKNTVSLLPHDFTGFIEIDDGKLFYRNFKLIFSIYRYEETDIKTILKNLPEIFLIEVYECLDDELSDIIINELNKKHIEVKKVATENSKKISATIDTKETSSDILISKYSDLQKYVGIGIYWAYLKPKRYKTDEGVIVFKNGEELSAIYKSKNKVLEGKKALGKIKTIFAISEVLANIKKISVNSFNKFLDSYPNSLLKTFVLFDDLIKKIKEKEFKLIKNDSLANVLTKNPSLIEISNNNMYIVSNEKKPVYAFFEEYDGDKSYRHIKNFCIFNDIEFKIYPLDENEFKLFREFRKNKIKVV